jgi:predicted nucleotidyltransferase
MSAGEQIFGVGGSSDLLAEVRAVVLEGLRGTGARVFLFGSRADGSAHATSDVDVAVLPSRPLAIGLMSRIREALDESTLPFAVDLVDLSDVDPEFRARVEREGLPWTD